MAANNARKPTSMALSESHNVSHKSATPSDDASSHISTSAAPDDNTHSVSHQSVSIPSNDSNSHKANTLAPSNDESHNSVSPCETHNNENNNASPMPQPSPHHHSLPPSPWHQSVPPIRHSKSLSPIEVIPPSSKRLRDKTSDASHNVAKAKKSRVDTGTKEKSSNVNTAGSSSKKCTHDGRNGDDSDTQRGKKVKTSASSNKEKEKTSASSNKEKEKNSEKEKTSEKESRPWPRPREAAAKTAGSLTKALSMNSTAPPSKSVLKSTTKPLLKLSLKPTSKPASKPLSKSNSQAKPCISSTNSSDHDELLIINCPEGASKYITKALCLFSNIEGHMEWSNIVCEWLDNDEAENFSGSTTLTMSGHPGAISLWIKNAHHPNYHPNFHPDISDLAEFESCFAAWWKACQPSWRKELCGTIAMSRKEGQDWECL